MAETVPGKLVWRGQGKDRKRLVMWQTRRGGMSGLTPCPDRELAAVLRAQQAEEIDVELELEKGRPCRIRPVGQPWTTPTSPIVPRQEHLRTSGGRSPVGQGAIQRTGQQRSPAEEVVTTHFHNPYNFVPALSRESARGTDLGDHVPIGHDRYDPDCYSGRLHVTLTVETPLLLPDTARVTVDKNDHKSFPVRLDRDGKPYITPTALKGMLRAAYEAVTNSRLSVFVGHDERLAYRMPAQVGPVPARVEKGDNGGLVFRVMKTNLLGDAAKLRRYRVGKGLGLDKGEADVALQYPDPDKTLPANGEAVWVDVHPRGLVQHIMRRTPGTTARPVQPGNWRPGWVCITGPNIRGKQYERVFLEGDQDIRIPVDSAHKQLWKELITNYRATHVTDRDKRQRQGQRFQDYLGDEPGRTGWSRHIYETLAEELREGTLCYIVFNQSGNMHSGIQALLPVTISRRLFSVSPDVLLDASLHPANDLAQLSPADRVFGWVNQHGKGAYRGQLRLGTVTCTTDNAIANFGTPGVPLAILGQPKPQQARFYVAADASGRAQEDHRPAEDAGYRPNKGLRGRKVYPHHRNLPADYWYKPLENQTWPRDSTLIFQEYRRPHGPDQRDDQNRSVQGWVHPGATFTFDIHVINLSAAELGALLWLLQLPPQHYHRLGGGKPLGFGSVRLDLDTTKSDIRHGTDWQVHYSSLEAVASPCDIEACVTVYKNAVQQAYGSTFDQVSFIAAFHRAAQGFDDGRPTHYPRTRVAGTTAYPPPPPAGELFKWFVANTRGGQQYALQDLADDRGLPILEDRDRPSASQRGGQPRRGNSGPGGVGRR